MSVVRPARRAAAVRLLAGTIVAIATAAAVPGASQAGIDPGPLRPPITIPLPAIEDDACVTGQTNDITGQLGLTGRTEVQLLCDQTPPGDPGDLKGFAFPLESCMDGAVDRVAINFRIGEPDVLFYIYLWRDQQALPLDACGLELYAGQHAIQEGGYTFSTYDLCDRGIPLADGERFWLGVIYRRVEYLFGANWYIGRNTGVGREDQAYLNESGVPGAWVDLNLSGLGNRYGIFVFESSDCGPVAVEPSSWGAVKALMR
jgi:hypothetical protein